MKINLISFSLCLLSTVTAILVDLDTSVSAERVFSIASVMDQLRSLCPFSSVTDREQCLRIRANHSPFCWVRDQGV